MKSTKVGLSLSPGRARSRKWGGEIAALMSRTISVANLRSSSTAIWRSSTSIGRKGLDGHVAGQMLRCLTDVTTMALGLNHAAVIFAGQWGG